MAAELTFTKNTQGHYEATFETSGDPMAIEIDRKEPGHLLIYASIDGMDGDLIFSTDQYDERTFVRSIEMPEGVTLRVVSFTEVIEAKITGV